MQTYFLSLGSNIEPSINLPKSIECLRSTFSDIQVSPIYETEPVGPSGDQKFWNAVVRIHTDYSSEKLSDKIREIENTLGRKRDPSDKFIPRTIDIDLLPQKNYQNYGFIMLPLADLAPEDIDLETGKTFRDLAELLPDSERKGCSVIK